VWLLVVGSLVLVVWLFLRRANELCVFRISNGELRLVGGRAPAGLLVDAGEVTRRAAIADATIRIVSEGGEPRLVANDALGQAVNQQLRNVVGQYRLLQFRTGRRP
jgi:regulator of protease activity HflC (stomatin/prohibitin superfamily)